MGKSVHLLYKIDHISASKNNDPQFRYHSYPQKQDAQIQPSVPALVIHENMN